MTDIKIVTSKKDNREENRMSNYVISAKDREILREVANKQYEFSQAEKNKKRIDEWYAHNS